MTSTNQIKCPNCDSIFKIDETNYLAIQSQVRDHLFEEQLKNGITTAVKLAEQKLINEHSKYVNEKNTRIQSLENKISTFDKDKELAVAEALKPILREKNNLEIKTNDYKEKLSTTGKDMKIAISEAIKPIEEERNKLKLQISKSKAEHELAEANLKSKHSLELKDKEDEIDRLNENKRKLSVKMIGETLEESCLIEYEKYIRRAIPSATFEKDNELVKNSKGDYIFRDFDENGNEIVSIMFEMKNESKESKNKRKNSSFYKKLDQDRRNKNCEYAVLVSTLEPENEQFNSGMTTVYHEYPKLIVIRPNCFISLIYTLIEIGLEVLEYKLLLQDEKTKTIDISNFKDSLNQLQKESAINVKRIFSSINKIVETQDKIIDSAKATKDLALKTLSKNSTTLNKKIQGISVDKLIKDNPTMIKLFEEQSDQEVIKEV